MYISVYLQNFHRFSVDTYFILQILPTGCEFSVHASGHFITLTLASNPYDSANGETAVVARKHLFATFRPVAQGPRPGRTHAAHGNDWKLMKCLRVDSQATWNSQSHMMDLLMTISAWWLGTQLVDIFPQKLGNNKIPTDGLKSPSRYSLILLAIYWWIESTYNLSM